MKRKISIIQYFPTDCPFAVDFSPLRQEGIQYRETWRGNAVISLDDLNMELRRAYAAGTSYGKMRAVDKTSEIADSLRGTTIHWRTLDGYSKSEPGIQYMWKTLIKMKKHNPTLKEALREAATEEAEDSTGAHWYVHKIEGFEKEASSDET